MIKKLMIIPAILTLAACGGGGGGGTTSYPTPTVLKTFGDGAGIARAEATDNGVTITANVMAGNINSYSPDEAVSAIDISNVSYTGSNQYGKSYSGPATVNGTSVNVFYYEDDGGEAFIMYGENAYGNAALAGGPKVSNIPSGTYNYYGTNIIGNRDGSYFEDGTFAMSVNFTNKTAAISGSTNQSTIGGNNISVNTSNGTFSSNNLTLTVNGASETASIFGNFHGNGATSVSGIYSDNRNIPVVAGAIAGRR